MVQGGGDGKIGGSRRRGRVFVALQFLLRCNLFCVAVCFALQLLLRRSLLCVAGFVAL